MFDETRVIDSAEGNVRKYVFTSATGVAESVLYRYPDYQTRTVICCSTMSGCPVGCRFCGAGDRFVRAFSAEEIVAQVDRCIADTGVDPAAMGRLQIMFMSMGEPLLNPKGMQGALLFRDQRWRKEHAPSGGQRHSGTPVSCLQHLKSLPTSFLWLPSFWTEFCAFFQLVALNWELDCELGAVLPSSDAGFHRARVRSTSDLSMLFRRLLCGPRPSWATFEARRRSALKRVSSLTAGQPHQAPGARSAPPNPRISWAYPLSSGAPRFLPATAVLCVPQQPSVGFGLPSVHTPTADTPARVAATVMQAEQEQGQ